jgi:hypothetical protein
MYQPTYQKETSMPDKQTALVQFLGYMVFNHLDPKGGSVPFSEVEHFISETAKKIGIAPDISEKIADDVIQLVCNQQMGRTAHQVLDAFK